MLTCKKRKGGLVRVSIVLTWHNLSAVSTVNCIIPMQVASVYITSEAAWNVTFCKGQLYFRRSNKVYQLLTHKTFHKRIIKFLQLLTSWSTKLRNYNTVTKNCDPDRLRTKWYRRFWSKEDLKRREYELWLETWDGNPLYLAVEKVRLGEFRGPRSVHENVSGKATDRQPTGQHKFSSPHDKC